MNKEFRLKFEKLSFSTQAYSILCVAAFIYTILAFLFSIFEGGASSGGSIGSIIGDLLGGVLRFIFSGNPVLCASFCAVCLLLSIAGRYIDHQCIMVTAFQGKVYYSTSYALKSGGWVIFSVVVSLVCTIALVV